jgi:hypothetical protein
MGNQQPWVRIFKRNWVQRWLPIGRAIDDRKFPVLWFEIKCHFEFDGNDGRPPFNVFVPIDEHGTSFGDRDFEPIPGRPDQYLPVPDTYRTLALILSGCYQRNVSLWAHNVTNSVNTYLQERHFTRGQNGYTLSRQRPRKKLDFGLVQVHHATNQEAQMCADFIITRAPTIDCVMKSG